MRNRLEELHANRADEDDTDYLSLLPRLLEWQRWLLIHTLELLPGARHLFRFRTILLLVGRQNGKSTVLTVLILWRLFQYGSKMVLETHASNEHARKAWEEVVAIAEAIPELSNEIRKIQLGKNSELLHLDSGERFKIATANRRGGRGFSGDFIIFDELREHHDWRSWSATSKTTMARAHAQVWGVSNAGDASAVVLRHLRTVALAAIRGEVPDGVPEDLLENDAMNNIGLFEWSSGTIDGTDKGAQRSIWDREGWAEANPSMGYTDLDERSIAASARDDPEWEFRTEVLCEFVNLAGQGPFPNGSWATIRDSTSARRDRGVVRDKTRPAAYCIDLSHSRTMAYIALAYWDTEGRRRIQIVAQRAGVDWIIPWLTDPRRVVKPDNLTIQSRGAPISSMRRDLEAAGLVLTPWEGPDLAGSCGQFYDAVRQAVADDDMKVVITHGDQPSLDLAAQTATIKPLGDGWVIDRKNSPEDAAPLMAAIGAHWLLMTNPVAAVSVYEERGMVVL